MEQTQFEALYPENARSEEIARIIRYIRDGASCQLLSIPGVFSGLHQVEISPSFNQLEAKLHGPSEGLL